MILAKLTKKIPGALAFVALATHNVIEVSPPLPLFSPAEDNSGNNNNLVLSGNRPVTLNPGIPATK